MRPARTPRGLPTILLSLVAVATTASAQERAASRAVFTLQGRAAASPRALAGATAELVFAGGTAASSALDAAGRYRLETTIPPDGGVVRLSSPAGDVVVFPAPRGTLAGETTLPERFLDDAEDLRPPGPAPQAARAESARRIDLFDAAEDGRLDARRLLRTLRLAAGEDLAAAWRPLSAEAVVAVVRGGDDAQVLGAVLSSGSAPSSGLRALVTAETSGAEVVLAGAYGGARFRGRLEFALRVPGAAENYRLPFEGTFLPTEFGGNRAAALRIPAGALLDGEAATEGAAPRRLRGGPGRATTTAAPGRAGVPRVDARDPQGRPLAVRVGAPGAAADTAFEDLVELIVAAEPDYLPARIMAGADAAGSCEVVLAPRPRLRVGAAGLPKGVVGTVSWRPAPDGAEVVLARLDANGEAADVPAPSAAGEYLLRASGFGGRAAPAPGGAPGEALHAQLTAPGLAALAGRVLDDGRAVAGARVRLVPWPDDPRLLAEWTLPRGRRAPFAESALGEPRVRVAVSDADGAFRFEDLDPGARLLLVEAPGRVPVAAPRLDLHGPWRVDVATTGAAAFLAPPLEDEPRRRFRRPYGLVRTDFFPAAPVDASGFDWSAVENRLRFGAESERGLRLRIQDHARRADAPPVLVHVWPEDVSGAEPTVAFSVRPGGDPVFVPLSGSGRVVVRVAGPEFPWTTFGPFELRPADAAPYAADPGASPALGGRVWTAAGVLAVGAEVTIEPEADRLLLGAAPPALRGRVDVGGELRAPPRPAGRARLTVTRDGERRVLVVDGAPADDLGTTQLEATVAAAIGDAAAEWFDADGRRLGPAEAARRATAGDPLHRRDGDFDPTRGTPVRQDRYLAGETWAPDAEGAPWRLLLSGYRPGTDVRLVPIVDDERDTRRPALETRLDAQGEARFASVAPGTYRVLYEGRDAPESVLLDRATGDPERAPVAAAERTRFAVAPFDLGGTRRLLGAKAVLRPRWSLGAGLGFGEFAETAATAGDGRAEFTPTTGERLVLDVVCAEPPCAARAFVGPFAPGVPIADLELKLPPAGRLRVVVKGRSSPSTPIPGVTVAVLIGNVPFASARTDSAGEAYFPLLPAGDDVWCAAAADGYVPELRRSGLFGGGGENRFEMHLEVASAAFVAAPAGEIAPASILPVEESWPFDARAFGSNPAVAPPAGWRPDPAGRFLIPTDGRPRRFRVGTSESAAPDATFEARPGVRESWSRR